MAADPKHRRQQAEFKGRLAEWRCLISLICRGYRLLGHRLKTPVGEIDILALHQGELVIIEVKYRPTHAQGWEALANQRWERLARAADWLALQRPALGPLPRRFDGYLVNRLGLARHHRAIWPTA